MVCSHGGLFFIRHNEIHDLTAGLLQEVCYDVQVEPSLLPLCGETISPILLFAVASVNTAMKLRWLRLCTFTNYSSICTASNNVPLANAYLFI